MMRLFASAFLAGLSGAAAAQSLDGEWQFERQGHDGRYWGMLILDQGNAARLKGHSERQHYVQCGYVLPTFGQIEIVFTFVKSDRGYSLDHFYCTGSGAALVCVNRDAAGNREPASFTLRRVGNLPESPAGRLEDICPARERPVSHARPAGDFG